MRAGKDKIGNSRRYSLLLGVSTLALLVACDSSAPLNSQKVRPGADRQIAAGASLPPAGTGRQYDAGVVAVDETRQGAQIGSIVAARAAEAQEAIQKEANKRDAEARAGA